MNHTELHLRRQSLARTPLPSSLVFSVGYSRGVLFVSLSSFDADPDDYARLADNWTAYGIFERNASDRVSSSALPLTLKELSRIQTPPNRRADETPKTFLSNLALSRNASIALGIGHSTLFTVLIVYGLAHYSIFHQETRQLLAVSRN